MKNLKAEVKAGVNEYEQCVIARVSRSPEPFASCHSEQSEESRRSGQAPRPKNLTQGKPCSERSESIREEEVTKQSRSAGACLPLEEGSEIVLKIRKLD